MVKTKVTNKQIKDGFTNIIVVGYCDLQSLLRCLDAQYYNAGVYGWNYDGYIYDTNTVILTGYRGMSGNIRPNYKTVSKYETKARTISNNWDLSYDTKQKKLKKLLDSFIKEVLKTA